MEPQDRRPWNRPQIRKVVVYDNSSFEGCRPHLVDSAILGRGGRASCSTADGQGWKAAGLPIEADKPRNARAEDFPGNASMRNGWPPRGNSSTALKDKSLQIVDARSEAEFCGIDKQKNKRAGRIPGAKHLEWIDLIDKKTQRFKTADQLRRALSRKPA